MPLPRSINLVIGVLLEIGDVIGTHLPGPSEAAGSVPIL